MLQIYVYSNVDYKWQVDQLQHLNGPQQMT